jgi:lysophospholipase L1-like esterase
MLDKVKAQYPDAVIYCCTIAPIGTWGTDTPYVEFVNSAGDGLRAQDYNQVIEQIAENKGASVIDLYDCGITLDNLTDTTADGVHPTPLGMGYIADQVKESLAAAVRD